MKYDAIQQGAYFVFPVGAAARHLKACPCSGANQHDC